ncbi:MAG: hypothetical protein Q7R93_00700 [bacterium]|nr:hypothetical protein [bacterium]
MWSTALFSLSLLGLIILFVCKALELSRGVTMPLERLRGVGDPIVERWWFYATTRSRTFLTGLLALCARKIKTMLQKAELHFDATVHKITIRLNRYLRGKRQSTQSRPEDVSKHLKTVLEKTEKKATESDPV